MKLIILVLNNVLLLDDLLEELFKVGIRGGTIIESQGMAKRISQSEENEYLVGFLKNLLLSSRPYNKTLMFVVKEEQLRIMKEVVDKVTGGLLNPNTGVMFALDLFDVYGINNKEN